MNIVFTPTDGITSRFIQEEYIPLTVSFNDKDYVKHIGFYYGDTDLCELIELFESEKGSSEGSIFMI